MIRKPLAAAVSRPKNPSPMPALPALVAAVGNRNRGAEGAQHHHISGLDIRTRSKHGSLMGFKVHTLLQASDRNTIWVLRAPRQLLVQRSFPNGLRSSGCGCRKCERDTNENRFRQALSHFSLQAWQAL